MRSDVIASEELCLAEGLCGRWGKRAVGLEDGIVGLLELSLLKLLCSQTFGENGF